MTVPYCCCCCCCCCKFQGYPPFLLFVFFNRLLRRAIALTTQLPNIPQILADALEQLLQLKSLLIKHDRMQKNGHSTDPTTATKGCVPDSLWSFQVISCVVLHALCRFHTNKHPKAFWFVLQTCPSPLSYRPHSPHEVQIIRLRFL